jgi:hypothetical protein
MIVGLIEFEEANSRIWMRNNSLRMTLRPDNAPYQDIRKITEVEINQVCVALLCFLLLLL